MHGYDRIAFELIRVAQTIKQVNMVSDMFARWLAKKMVRAKLFQNADVTRW